MRPTGRIFVLKSIVQVYKLSNNLPIFVCSSTINNIEYGARKVKIPNREHCHQNKKPNKEGKVALYLCYNINTTPVTITTDIFVKPDDWDSKTQTVKSKNPAAVRLNNQLKLQREKWMSKSWHMKGT